MATRAEKTTSAAQRRPSRRGWRPGHQREAYLFLLPSFLGFVLFIVGPVLASLALSLVRWNLLNPPVFIGLGNYTEIFTRDPLFFQAFSNTLFYAVTIVPLQLLAGLTIALALNQGLRGVKIYRLIYFMPVVSSVVAAALIFQWMFNRDFGVISAIFWWLGDITGLPIAPPDWLNSSAWAKPAIVLLTVWKNMGFTMVIYLAGLQAVPEELYDAAKVDGASAWQRLRSITLPLISPTTFFLLIIQMIGAFQLFSEPFVMTRGQGGPAGATMSIVFYIYQAAFKYSQMGKASAGAWVLFAFIFACTLIQNRLQKRWVHYEAGEA
ncbi:MAG: sugar ABC transporter permease [Kouleothrix sp.]|jgi:multiple sugar transport system permease protein|nr:sugar ABC transporter permease [Kouleothrix sp.]